MARAGGIDLGGTKIEACLFDADWQPISRDRIPTPTQDYGQMIAEVAAMAQAMRHAAGDPALPIGVGMPGVVNPDTGAANTANLPATGKPLHRDLRAAIGGPVSLGNDCRFFALSEAVFGAAKDAATMYGLIIGTGIAGGYAAAGRLLHTLGGVAGELGHVGLPASVIAALDLPVIDCGCGRRGCYETLAAGPGLTRIFAHLTGKTAAPTEIFAAAGSGTEGPGPARAIAIWHDILGEMLASLQLMYDPEVIVLGGGLSKVPGLLQDLAPKLAAATLANTRPPALVLAEFGDASGVRGAAFAAWQDCRENRP